MLEVLDSTKALYLESSHKELVISIPNKNLTLTNVNIVSESMTLEESIETENELKFKGCNASRFKFQCAELLIDIRGEYLEATIQAGNTEVIPVFSGYVEKQNNRTYEDVVTEIECYDVLYKIRELDVTAWYNGLSSTRTVKQIRDSLFDYIYSQYGYSITQETTTLPCDSLECSKIKKEKLTKNIQVGNVLESLCEVNARFGQIGRDGKFYYRKLSVITKGTYPSPTTYPADDLYPSAENTDRQEYGLDLYSKISYEPYNVSKIDGVSIKDINGNSTSYGNATNMFNIADNIIAQSLKNKSTACQLIYNEVKELWYVPCTLNCVGLPWVECGDIVLSRTRKNIVRTYILHRTLKGIQALFDELEAKGEQYRDKYSESEETGISSNRDRVEKIESDYIKTAQLEAVDAKIDNLTAIAITTQNLSAQNISANQINAGKLSLQYLQGYDASVNVLTVNGLTATVGITAETLTIRGQSGYLSVTDRQVTIDGTTIKYWGWS